MLQGLQHVEPGLHLRQDLGRGLGRVEQPRAALGDQHRGRAAEHAQPDAGLVGEPDQLVDDPLDLALHVAARGQGLEDDVGVPDALRQEVRRPAASR